jgi:hypothetical protein
VSFDRNDRFLTIAGGAVTPAKTFWIYKTNAAGKKTDSTKYTVAATNANPDTLQADPHPLRRGPLVHPHPGELHRGSGLRHQDSAVWERREQGLRERTSAEATPGRPPSS